MVLSAAAGSAAAQIVFELPVAVPLSHLTEGVIGGDVNGDGHADLVTMPRFEGAFLAPKISVLLGDGAGGFGAPIVKQLNTQSSGRGQLVAINGDGFPDLALAYTPIDNAGVTFLINDGAGNFTPAQSFDLTGVATIDVRLADLNADGVQDILVLDQGAIIFAPGKLHLVKSVGGGAFTISVAATLQFGTLFFATGDVNGDTVLDVVASNSFSGTISVVAGLGGGAFASPVHVTVGGSPGELVLTDLDGDAVPDIALAERSGDRVLVLHGDGRGAFDLLQDVAVGDGPVRLSAGQLDGDGALDLLVSNEDGGDVSVLRGAGDGTFAAVATVSNVTAAGGSALADFDEDGTLDAALGQLTAPQGKVSVLLNHTYAAGSPFTDLGQAFPGTNGYPIQLAEGDLQSGTPVDFQLHNALPLGNASLVLGFSQVNAPFKGGVMVPAVDVLITPLPISAAGSTTIGGAWPPGIPAAFTFYVQYWFKDSGALNYEAGSSAVRVVAP